MPGIFKKKETEILLEAFNLGQSTSQPQSAAMQDDSGFFTLSHLRNMFAPFVLRREKVGILAHPCSLISLVIYLLPFFGNVVMIMITFFI